MSKKGRVIDFLVLFTIILFVYRGWFMPGMISRGDWVAFSNEWMLDHLSRPFAWMNLCLGGRYKVAFGSLAHYPFWWTQGAVTRLLGTDFSVTERLLWFYPFLIISFSSIYYLTYLIFKKRSICFIASLFYLINNLIVWRGHCGQMSILMAYALVPLSLAFFIKSLKKDLVRNSLLTGLILAISMVYEFRITVLTGALILSYALFSFVESRNKETLRKIFLSSIIFSGVVLWLHSFWLLSLFLVRQGQPLIPGHFRGVSLSLVSFLHVLALSAGQEGMDYGQMLLLPDQVFRPALFLIPILVFLPLFFKEKKREPMVRYLAILSLILIFFAKGQRWPLGNINRWFYSYVPFFAIFKVPLKFMYLQALPYSLLLGISIEAISHRFKQKIKRKDTVIQIGVVFFASLILIAAIWPAIIGPHSLTTIESGSTFKPFVPPEYFRMNEWLQKEPPGYSSLWFPTSPSYSAYNQAHPAFWPGNRGYPFYEYERYFFPDSFLYGDFEEERTDRLGKILGLANIKYFILLPQSDKRWHWVGGSQRLEKYRAAIEKQKDLTRVNLGDSNIYIYKNQYALPHFYSPANSALVVGELSVLYPLSLLNIDFGDWAFFFSHQLQERSFDIWKQMDTVIFYEKGIDELIEAGRKRGYNQKKIASLLSQKEVAFIKEIETNSSFEETHGKWELSKKWLGEASRGEVLTTESPSASLGIPFKALNRREYRLALRLAMKDFSGRLTIRIDGEPILSKNFHCESSPGLLWLESAPFIPKSGKHEILLTKEGGGILDLDEMIIYTKMADIADLFTTGGSPSVSWRMINPTRYEVELERTRPGFLIFAENHHPLWVARINGETMNSTPGNCALNSFLIDKKGKRKVVIEFTPQRYVMRGSYISLSGLILIGGYLLGSMRKKRKR